MPEIWNDVDAAVTVPVNIFPLTDDTDFKSRETGITYDQAGMDLVWNFQTTAGVTSQTAVTPTTAGDYDWTHSGDAMYKIEIPASGGGSINNDAEGFGWFSGFATGVLPWRGPILGFRAAGLNNLLIDSAYSATRALAGTALPNAVADAAGGLVISDAGGLDIDTQLAATNEITAARMGALTDWINGGRLDLILDIIAADVVNIDGSAIPTAAAIVNEWETQSQADPTGFHVNLQEIGGTAQTANDNGADINTILSRIIGTLASGTHNPASAAQIAVLSDWINGGRLDLILDIIAVDTTTDIPVLIATAQADLDILTGADGATLATSQLNYTPNTVVPDVAGTAPTAVEIRTEMDSNSVDLNQIQTDIAALQDIAASDVLTQVNAALDTAIAELGVAAPTATPTLRTGLMLMYMMARNQVDVDTTGTDAMKINNNAGTQITSKAITDDGTDYSEAKMA